MVLTRCSFLCKKCLIRFFLPVDPFPLQNNVKHLIKQVDMQTYQSLPLEQELLSRRRCFSPRCNSSWLRTNVGRERGPPSTSSRPSRNARSCRHSRDAFETSSNNVFAQNVLEQSHKMSILT
jgi:hypothetical protein